MRKWINLAFFLLVIAAIGIALLERNATNSGISSQETIIEVENVLDR